MASTYSTNLALELIALGEQGGGVWGTTTNKNLGTLVEQAISGYVTQAITDGADTVITIPNGATGVARNMYIECTGVLTAGRNLVVPTNKKLYFIFNNTSGGNPVTVKVSGQTGVSVPAGKKVALVVNGTDVVSAENYVASLSAGAIDGTPIGSTTPSTGVFTTLTANTSITAPTITASSSLVVNGTASGTGFTALFAAPPPIGTTTPNLATFTGVSVTGSTIPNNGMYLGAANTLRFSTNSTQVISIASTGNVSFIPTTDETLRIVRDAGYIAFWNTANSTRSGFLRFQATSAAQLDVEINQALNIYTNATLRMIIGAAGPITTSVTTGVGLTVTGDGAVHSCNIDDAAGSSWKAGYLGLPTVTHDGNYVGVLADAGKQWYHTSGSTHTWTIPSNASVAYDVGTVIIMTNIGTGNVTVAITTDTLRWEGSGTAGSRTLAQYGRAVAIKVASTTWFISGTNLS